MEQHSLVLLSGSTLDHPHINANSRRTPLPGPRRPLRNLAQGIARLLPQLRQLSQRLRRAPSLPQADAPVVRTWAPSPEASPDASLTTAAPCSLAVPQPPVRCHRAARWRMPRMQRAKPKDVSALLHEHDPARPQEQTHECNRLAEESMLADQEVPQVTGSETVPRIRRGPLRQIGRALRVVGAHLRPMGPGENDKNVPERVLNVATCGMFFQAGGKIIRLCRATAARRFGWAFMVVGVIATVYHGSWGRFRNTARKIDYYSIALASMLLRSAVVGALPRWLAGAMLLATPFKPSLVSTSNFMAVEVRYMLLALTHRQLLAEWAVHMSMSAAATACFTLEDTPLLSWFPYTHASFHALSAGAFLMLPSALNHITEALPAAAA